MLTCKEVAYRTSDYWARDLTLWQRLLFRFHVLMCVNCRRFVGQMGLLTAAMQRRPLAEPDDAQLDRWMAHLPDDCGCGHDHPPSH
jgi:hypothetical protein